MLLSSVIHIEALERGAIPQFIAPALRAEVLNWVGEKDKSQPELLHEGNELRPYTISNLKGTFQNKNGFHYLQAGDSAWFRLTSLTEAQSRFLQDEIFPSLVHKEFSLNKIKFRVTSLAEKHPWAMRATYAELVEKYFNPSSSFANALQIKFDSSTNFSAGQINSPFPMPKTVFANWLTRWNTFSKESHVQLPQTVTVQDLKKENIALNRYDLHTTSVEYGDIKWVGFEGQSYYRILTQDDFWIRLCHLLAEFSFYCGTGKNTTVGFGQTRKIDELDWKNTRP